MPYGVIVDEGVLPDIFTAARRGDHAAARRFIEGDAAHATTKDSRGWDSLTHLWFSKYLRLDRSKTGDFVRTATALLDAGASPNSGFCRSTFHR